MSNSRRSLRVLMVVNPSLPVPPARYGGTQRIAAALAEGLTERGDRVTMLAGAGSSVAGVRHVAIRYRFPAAKWLRLWWFLRFFARVAVLSRRADVIISFWREDFLRGALPKSLPVVLTHHDPIHEEPPDPTSRTVRISVSDDQREGLECAEWQTIHNGVDTDFFTPDPQRRGGYIAFLGRLSPEKGADTAVRVCQRAGVRLRIGGNLPGSAAARDVFDREVRPHLGTQVEWLGELDDIGKLDLLRGADALLFPIRWREPFGLVMAEALACGTPVVALRAGSTPEVVHDGRTGLLCDDEDALVDALGRITTIDRARCRQDALERFSERQMVERYLAVIDGLVGVGS